MKKRVRITETWTTVYEVDPDKIDITDPDEVAESGKLVQEDVLGPEIAQIWEVS